MSWQTPNPYVIDTRSVHTALPRALSILLQEGFQEDSRNGPVLLMGHPVMTVYRRPWERVTFWHERDANPFFHFMESLLFLAGRFDVEGFAQYAKQIRAYSDNGKTLPASYGVRWRSHFDFDQPKWAIKRLRANPNDRRTVISMWNPFDDPIHADNGSKDVPCNTNIFLGVRNNRLNMMVNCRSNDIFWGAYGANAVHMSMLQEYLARSIGVAQGRYYQNSFNWHAYDDFYRKVMNERHAPNQEQSLRRAVAAVTDTGCEENLWNPYTNLELNRGGDAGAWITAPLMEAPKPNPIQPNTVHQPADYEAWDAQLTIFLEGGSSEDDGLTDLFFTTVAVPIRDAHALYRKKQYDEAFHRLNLCAATDWRRGCQDWLQRRAAERALPTPEPDSAHP